MRDVSSQGQTVWVPDEEEGFVQGNFVRKDNDGESTVTYRGKDTVWLTPHSIPSSMIAVGF